MMARRTHSGSGRIRVPPAVMRLAVRLLGGRCLDAAQPWQVQRARLEQLEKAVLLPRGTAVTDRIMGGIRAQVVSARGQESRCTVIHFHGGGYCLGSVRRVMPWAAQLSAQTGCEVVLPEYQLAP